ncbi:cation:proton antiporter [Vallicoccus soli]|uniref:Sodium:proton antiporter n=1 Tax=Vallicoccus soli TaxID=2339232 RepID=A0A3A3Z351_9ACTN|nr:cation:proton antiporter [Vallicoccus soli]RJK97139.1 sodium:proton antiporter [Vallicoccus soli]
MDATSLAYAAAGSGALLAALLPRALRSAPVSMPMIFLALGVVGFAVVDGLPTPDPVEHAASTTHLSEAAVIVALMGAGLALDRPPSWRGWSSTWRLLGITMPLTMLAVGFGGWWLLGLGVPAAVLLAAVVAPTDPVLATEVQVGEPSGEEDSEDEPRFALTSEAGLNDGLAFPFTYAAIAMLTAGTAAPSAWLGEWLLVDVLWRGAVGVVGGLLVGRVLARLFFHSRIASLRLAEEAEGFVALACTFLAYGLTELAEGYGFVAVFVCACTIRAAERDHGYHQVMHQFIEQVERLLTVAVLVLLGGSVADGLFADLGWQEWALALGTLLVARPLAGWVGLLGGRTGPRERFAVAFFGVRGIGSVYYLAYATEQTGSPQVEGLWGVTGLVVVLSVVLHGVTASPVMRWVDRERVRRASRLTGGRDPDLPTVNV